MMKGKFLAALPLVFLLVLLTVPAVSPAEYEIRPGGSYRVRVDVRKPPFLRLAEHTWEVRAYFYDRDQCFNEGRWVEIGGARLYDGWWRYRYRGDEWMGTEEERSISISVDVVNHPRDPEDRMEEIPVGGAVRFRVRLIIYLDEKPEFSVPEEEEPTSGIIYFNIGGARFQYQFVREFDDYVIREEDFEGAIDLSAGGKWRLIIDKDASASVSWDAPDVDIFFVPDIEANLELAAGLEYALELPSEVRLAIAVPTVVVPVAVAAYLVLRRRGEEESLLPE
jgi:hypothetical protein